MSRFHPVEFGRFPPSFSTLNSWAFRPPLRPPSTLRRTASLVGLFFQRKEGLAPLFSCCVSASPPSPGAGPGSLGLGLLRSLLIVRWRLRRPACLGRLSFVLQSDFGGFVLLIQPSHWSGRIELLGDAGGRARLGRLPASLSCTVLLLRRSWRRRRRGRALPRGGGSLLTTAAAIGVTCVAGSGSRVAQCSCPVSDLALVLLRRCCPPARRWRL